MTATSTRDIGHWIGGPTPGNGPTAAVVDPATGDVTARVALGGAEVVDEAVAAAAEAQTAREEVFGPVLAVVRRRTWEEAIALVNRSPYGNGAVLFTADGAAARAFESEVTAGAVGVNVPIPIPVSQHSFGGWKDSMFGEYGMYGEDGVACYTRMKVVTSRWPRRADAGVDLGFPTNH